MTKKQKTAAKSAAASRRYRAKLKTKTDVVSAARTSRRATKNVGTRVFVGNHGVLSGQTLAAMEAVAYAASEQTAKRMQEQADRSNQPADVAYDRMADDGYNNAALNPTKTAPGEQGAFSAMTSRLDNLIERARIIRNRQGDSLMEAVGTRESVPTKGEVAQAGNAVQPPRGIIIAQMINHLDSIISELDGQSRIICNTLA